MDQEPMLGAKIVLKALVDQGVDVLFGYPGGAILPIYDELFQQNQIKHVLVRHEQAAVHAAEGYARSTGKVGVVLVTSGPGATNTVTGLTDAMMDSVPVVCLTGQVATHLIGTDSFQEADTTGITRQCTKHNYLVKSPNDVARVIHEGFYVASNGRPGPVVIDLPKDVLMSKGTYIPPGPLKHKSYRPQVKGDAGAIAQAVDLLAQAKRPIIYAGGGVINSGPAACRLLTTFTRMSGCPITLTLMGLGAYPASDKQFLGMLGMHGTYEANMAMHDCDVMVCVGARFDDRVTGLLSGFSPNSKKIHIDIDASSINKNVAVDVAVVGDVAHVLADMITMWEVHPEKTVLAAWWAEIQRWRSKECLNFIQDGATIKPQYAVQRLYDLTRDQDTYITTEVGQHQMWAAQYYHFDRPRRWMTSGGLGTMGYGLPSAIGVQMAHPGALVVDISGEASFMMNMQELATAVQYRLPIKIFILNNCYMGMVRQWQELLHESRYCESYSQALPDFVKLAESFGAVGMRVSAVDTLDDAIHEAIATDRPVLMDICVEQMENCFPMIPSGKPHNEMLLGPLEDGAEAIDEDGKMLL